MAESMEQIAEVILRNLPAKQRLIIAIDGRCAAGKTTLAAYLQRKLSGSVFHMDDFFLRPKQRTAQRLDTPGGNVDYERFSSEILLPLLSGARRIAYRPYDCKTQALKPLLTLDASPVNIVEGSYSCHPALWDFYDVRIFLSISPEEQMRRIKVRNGELQFKQFQTKWIPLEERYFSVYRIKERCDYCF